MLRKLIFLAAMLGGMSPGIAFAQEPVATLASHDSVCSEICVAQAAQEQIADYVANGRPAWADLVFVQLQDYASCGVRAVEKDGRQPFVDFDETDALFDLAAIQCRSERDAFDQATAKILVEKGFFNSAEQAAAEFIPLRALAVTGAMTEKFDQETGSFSSAIRYYVNRLPVLYNVTQADEESADISESQEAGICSEMCIIAKSQDFLLEITSRKRPAWARIILVEMPPYAACGVRVISQNGGTLYEDFDETDRAFDRAYVECADERSTLDDTVRTKLLTDRVFASAEEADAQIIPLRAMLFGVKMSDVFDPGGLASPANLYAESRFPEFYNGFLNRRFPPKAPAPPPATIPQPQSSDN